MTAGRGRGSGVVRFAPYCPVYGFFDGFELPDQRLVGAAFAVAYRVGARKDLDTATELTEKLRGPGIPL